MKFDLYAPDRKGVSWWLFLPNSVDSDIHFDPETGQHRHRGYKKGQPIAVLEAADKHGKTNGRREDILAPADGYVRVVPVSKRYLEPGELVAEFEEGYVYHWRFYKTRHKRLARRRAVVYHNYPRLQYGAKVATWGTASLLAALLLSAGVWQYVAALALLICAPLAIVNGVCLLLGKRRLRQYGKHVRGLLPRLVENTAFKRAVFGSLAVMCFLWSVEASHVGSPMNIVWMILTIFYTHGAVAGDLLEGPLVSRILRTRERKE